MPSNTVDHMQAAEDELKRKMEEINRQIAAQEMEIAGLLTGEPTVLLLLQNYYKQIFIFYYIFRHLVQLLLQHQMF